jgi:thioredoxin 1
LLKITNNLDDFTNEDHCVVYFTAEWCNPCRQLKPHYGKVAVIDSKTNYYLVDVDEMSRETMEHYNIKSIPQIFVMHKGEIVKPIIGRTSHDILKEMGKTA